MGGNLPVIVWTSEAQTPQASIATSMSWSSKGFIFTWRCQGGEGGGFATTYILLVESAPFLWVGDGKAGCCFWVRHFDGL